MDTARLNVSPADRAPEPLLAMNGVTIGGLKEPERVVVEAVDWAVVPGEFWAIGGLHASGKSAFLAVAAGLARPLAGSYRVFGCELATAAEPDLRRVRLRLGLVFDGGQLLGQLTVAENVALPICYHHELTLEQAAEPVARWLEATGLGPLAHHRAGTVSRTWQRRAGLARALALAPEVLLVDSPLSGLDPRDAGWWLDFLSQLAAGHPLLGGRPVTLVVSADDLRPWSGRANRFAVLGQRRFLPLAEGGAPWAAEELLRHLLEADAGPAPV